MYIRHKEISVSILSKCFYKRWSISITDYFLSHFLALFVRHICRMHCASSGLWDLFVFARQRLCDLEETNNGQLKGERRIAGHKMVGYKGNNSDIPQCRYEKTGLVLMAT